MRPCPLNRDANAWKYTGIIVKKREKTPLPSFVLLHVRAHHPFISPRQNLTGDYTKSQVTIHNEASSGITIIVLFKK